jgi:2-polyprenyl-3-methyl-5-hydroxy-6-metoxy-1,4-benzoquinol methylase
MGEQYNWTLAKIRRMLKLTLINRARLRSDYETIRACYKVFLGREPENKSVVIGRVGMPLEDILTGILSSEEYKAKVPTQVLANYRALLERIDVNVSDEKLQEMFQRIAEEWGQLGEEDPFWSVSANEEFQSNVINDEIITRLYEAGRMDAALIDVFSLRNEVEAPRGGICVELGSGVGRVTKHLAERFDTVIAIDISQNHLKICESHLNACGIKNVEYMLLKNPESINEVAPYDYFLSIIVLQHNPPPVQKYLLDKLLGRAKKGASALFQLLTGTLNYSFDVDQYLRSTERNLEMHCLPMHNVFRVFEKHGFSTHEARMDGWTTLYGSYTFFASKQK